jgi:hypothetical protein
MSGRRSSSSDGSPAGRAQEDRDRVLRLGPGAQCFLDDSLGSGELHFGLRDVHPGDRSGIEPRLIDVERFASSVDRGLRDDQPIIQIAKLQVGGRDVGHQGDRDAAERFLRRQELVQRRFVGAAELAPEVDLPEHRESAADADVRLSPVFRAGGRGGSRSAREVVDARVEIRPGKAQYGPRLRDPRQSNAQVAVVLERAADQLLQRGVLEQVPPIQVRDRRTGRIELLEGFGGRRRRPVVIGAHGAGGDQQREEGNESWTAHLSFSVEGRASRPG